MPFATEERELLSVAERDSCRLEKGGDDTFFAGPIIGDGDVFAAVGVDGFCFNTRDDGLKGQDCEGECYVFPNLFHDTTQMRTAKLQLFFDMCKSLQKNCVFFLRRWFENGITMVLQSYYNGITIIQE